MKFLPYEWKAADMIGGSPAVDFVNTASNWTGETVDRLDGPKGFAAWAALAGLIDEGGVEEIFREIERHPDAAPRVYGDGRKLRATLWRTFDALAGNRAVDATDLEALSEWTRRAAQKSRLVQSGAGFVKTWTDEASPLERPLLAIALDAGKLLEEGAIERLHRCAGCEWLFLDRSKNARRRWCSMATCGNDAKVRKFRKRRKAT
jgi:predicted RNA-binding Zn ribbon-like protein